MNVSAVESYHELHARNADTILQRRQQSMVTDASLRAAVAVQRTTKFRVVNMKFFVFI